MKFQLGNEPFYCRGVLHPANTILEALPEDVEPSRTWIPLDGEAKAALKKLASDHKKRAEAEADGVVVARRNVRPTVPMAWAEADESAPAHVKKAAKAKEAAAQDALDAHEAKAKLAAAKDAAFSETFASAAEQAAAVREETRGTANQTDDRQPPPPRREFDGSSTQTDDRHGAMKPRTESEGASTQTDERHGSTLAVTPKEAAAAREAGGHKAPHKK